MVTTAPSYPPKVRRVGLGYELIHMGHGVRMRVDRLRDTRDGMKGEILVQAKDALIVRGIRETLTSRRERKGLIEYLSSREDAVPWAEYVELLFTATLDGQRTGDPTELLGTFPPREQPLFRLAPILQHGKATVLFGAGGSGKSTLAKAIALSVASGQVVVPGWQPTQAPVLVLDYETDKYDWQEDVQTLAGGIGTGMPGCIHYRRMVTTVEASIEPLAALVLEREIGLVIVDSVEPAAGRVREGGDASDTTHRLHDALALLGTTSLLVDHVTGDGAEHDSTTRRPYGSVYKENRARNVFMLRADFDSGDRLLVNTKVNRGPRMAPLGLRFEWQADSPYRITPAAISSPVLARASGKVEELRVLSTDGRALATRAICDALEWKPDTVRRVLFQRPDLFVRLPDGTVALQP